MGTAFVVLLTSASFVWAEDAGVFPVVGYLPQYRVGTFDAARAKLLTHVVYFSLTPREQGEFDENRQIESHLPRLRQMKADAGVRLSICVGGWEKSKAFPAIAASVDSRDRFAAELTKFCGDYGFDGADLDWEHPSNAKQEADYGRLLAAVKKKFVPAKLELTIAAAGWQRLTPEAIASIDRLHLMAYDGAGRHSTLEMAKSDVERMMTQGVPAAKICLGVPFYGRGIKTREARPYRDLVKAKSIAPETDEVDGVYFNGPRTIAAKVAFARERRLGGMMIWELGHDTEGKNSLLKALHDATRK